MLRTPGSPIIKVTAALSLFGAVALAIAAHQPRESYVYFDPSVWSNPLQCTAVAPRVGGDAVADLIPVDDSTFAALFASERELVIYNRAFQAVSRLRFDKEGPRGVRNPVGAAVTDSLIFIADDGAAVIRKFDYAGADRGTVRLNFLPRRIRLGGDGLLITPLVGGNTPAHLLFQLRGGVVERLGAPIARYEDLGINTLANMTSLVVFPGRAILMHELAVPFGYVFDTNTAQQLRRFAVPLPDAARSRVGHLPKPPLTEKNVNEFTVVAFAAAASRGARKIYYVTRVGDGVRHNFRKLLVELNADLQLEKVYPIDVNPHHLVYVSNPSAVISVDAEDNWSECRLP